MFRFIGIIVVAAVLVIGFTSLQKLYEGKSSAAETVESLRNELGSFIKPNPDDKSFPVNTEDGKLEEKQSDSLEYSTENSARELIKSIND